MKCDFCCLAYMDLWDLTVSVKETSFCCLDVCVTVDLCASLQCVLCQ